MTTGWVECWDEGYSRVDWRWWWKRNEKVIFYVLLWDAEESVNIWRSSLTLTLQSEISGWQWIIRKAKENEERKKRKRKEVEKPPYNLVENEMKRNFPFFFSPYTSLCLLSDVSLSLSTLDSSKIPLRTKSKDATLSTYSTLSFLFIFSVKAF